MLEFASTEGHLSGEFLVWLIDFLGFEEHRQNEMLGFLLQRGSSREVEGGRGIKNDCFYRFCLKFDMPLFEELAVAAYARFKHLPEELQQRYFRMIGIEEWTGIKQDLVNSYRSSSPSDIYLKAFMLIVDKLEGQIKRGASIYGEDAQQRIKRKEEVFALFYKILIIEAHRNILQIDPKKPIA